MEVGQELHDHFGGEVYFDCHNVERDKDNFESLEWEVNTCRPSYPSVSVETYHGNFEDHVNAILKRIPAGAASLYFLDPWGYQGIAMVVKLLERRYNEVIVTFMSSFWNRFLGDRTKASAHDENFDTPEWRELLDSRHRQQELVKFYGHQIQQQAREKLGLEEVYVYPIDVDFGDRDQDIYHLIHVSRPPRARSAMEEAVRGATALLKQDALSLYDTSVHYSNYKRVRDRIPSPIHGKWHAASRILKSPTNALQNPLMGICAEGCAAFRQFLNPVLGKRPGLGLR